MNIFVLDYDVRKAAQYHCDKHVNKLLLEACQMLSTVVREKYKLDIGYRPGWENHPCTKWVAQTNMNWGWLFILARELSKEYTYRYGRRHKCQDLLDKLEDFSRTLEADKLTPPYLAMPDDCKLNDTVQSYRKYYLDYKTHLLTYTRREVPEWIKQAGLGTCKEAKWLKDSSLGLNKNASNVMLG